MVTPLEVLIGSKVKENLVVLVDNQSILREINRWVGEGIIGHPIDSGMGLSITIDKLRVFINKTLSTQSLINQLLIKRVGLSIVIDNGKIGQGMRSGKCTNHNLYAGGCQ